MQDRTFRLPVERVYYASLTARALPCCWCSCAFWRRQARRAGEPVVGHMSRDLAETLTWVTFGKLTGLHIRFLWIFESVGILENLQHLIFESTTNILKKNVVFDGYSKRSNNRTLLVKKKRIVTSPPVVVELDFRNNHIYRTGEEVLLMTYIGDISYTDTTVRVSRVSI